MVVGYDASEVRTMERDRKVEQDESRTTGVEVGGRGTPSSEAAREHPGRRAAKLMPRPDQGRSLPEALEESMRDHHDVYAALAK